MSLFEPAERYNLLRGPQSAPAAGIEVQCARGDEGTYLTQRCAGAHQAGISFSDKAYPRRLQRLHPHRCILCPQRHTTSHKLLSPHFSLIWDFRGDEISRPVFRARLKPRNGSETLRVLDFRDQILFRTHKYFYEDRSLLGFVWIAFRASLKLERYREDWHSSCKDDTHNSGIGIEVVPHSLLSNH